MLEAAAEKLQAALLASIEEETATKQQQQQQPKGKQKAGKKGKRSKKSGSSTPTAQPAESAAQEAISSGSAAAYVQEESCQSHDSRACEGSQREEAAAEPSDGTRSEAGSDSTTFDDRGGQINEEQPYRSGPDQELTAQSSARVSCDGEDGVEWKEVSTCHLLSGSPGPSTLFCQGLLSVVSCPL